MRVAPRFRGRFAALFPTVSAALFLASSAVRSPHRTVSRSQGERLGGVFRVGKRFKNGQIFIMRLLVWKSYMGKFLKWEGSNEI